MRSDRFHRRDFHKLSAAALGGMLAGTLGGCGDQPASSSGKALPPAPAGGSQPSKSGGTAVAATSVALHACRGLNECKGQGRDHKNNCAGQGNCYTVTHDCSGKNDCKFQGGCGGENGLNSCKGKGGCGHFPISEADIWKKARSAFEDRMKKAGKTVGPAPAAKA